MRPVALSLLLALLAPLTASAADKPNILVLYMDDMGWAQP
ncbi:MAG: hypothetical protein RL749_1244, partial [Verrucomicrobiota bacterium]